ncbi:MAG: LuxR C-terminal-related transcriptional regulator [Thermomicrobiales bacterium]
MDDRSHTFLNAPQTNGPGEIDPTARPVRALLTLSEAADALGLGRAAIRDAIAAGELLARQTEDGWLISVDDLLRFTRQKNLPLPLVPWERDGIFEFPRSSGGDLPTPRAALIGREAEVAAVRTQLEDPTVRLVTLTGAGGIGKTRLALAVAEAMRGQLADGVIFVDLSAVRHAPGAVPAIAQALGLREIAGQDQLHQIVGFLRSREALLIIDNVEQIIAAAPEIAQIGRLADTTLLVTSRAPLRVSGEREFPVPPLLLAGEQATPEELLASAAGRLFVERARAHDAAFAVDARNAPLIAQVCARLDGLPLAIELAAARTRLLSPRQLRDRLDSSLPLLTSGDRDAPPRHLTMRDAVAWSYDLLTPDEQRLFRQVAVFSGGFTLDAVEWIGSDEQDHAAEAAPLDWLDALLTQSLVVREAGLDGEPRYRLLETIRAFGLEQMAPEEEARYRDQHARFFGNLTQELRPLVVTEAARTPLERLAADDANLRAALTWLAERGAPAEFGALVAALSGYWLAYSLLAEADMWISRALAQREHLSLADQARVLNGRAIFSGFLGDFDAADRAFDEGIPLSQTAGNPLDIAMALTSCGAMHNVLARYAEAERVLDEGRTVAAAVADPAERAAIMGRALANLSVTARSQGDLARARAMSEAALACYQGFGFDLAETRTLMDLADIARFEGDQTTMVSHYQACLARTGERGDMRVVVDALSGIAGACTEWGQLQTAVRLYGAAQALRERVGLGFMLPRDKELTEHSVAQLRDALSAAGFEAGLSAGRALPVTHAIAIAAAVTPAAGEAVSVQPDAPLFTRRELEVLRLLAAGHTDRDIAEALYIGQRTVSWHVGAILGKLGVKSRREAASRALADGLV